MPPLVICRATFGKMNCPVDNSWVRLAELSEAGPRRIVRWTIHGSVSSAKRESDPAEAADVEHRITGIGAWLSLVERHVRDVEAARSNRVAPIIKREL